MRRLVATWVLVVGVAAVLWGVFALTGGADVHAGALPASVWRPAVVLSVPVGLLLVALAASGLTRSRGTLAPGPWHGPAH